MIGGKSCQKLVSFWKKKKFFLNEVLALGTWSQTIALKVSGRYPQMYQQRKLN